MHEDIHKHTQDKGCLLTTYNTTRQDVQSASDSPSLTEVPGHVLLSVYFAVADQSLCQPLQDSCPFDAWNFPLAQTKHTQHVLRRPQVRTCHAIGRGVLPQALCDHATDTQTQDSGGGARTSWPSQECGGTYRSVHVGRNETHTDFDGHNNIRLL